MIQSVINNVKWFNDLTNGINFNVNTGVFSPVMTGNVGQRVKVEFDYSFTATVETADFGGVTCTKVGSVWWFDISGNWFVEGFYVGSTVEITGTGFSLSQEDVTLVTGSGFTRLILTDNQLTTNGLTNGLKSDIVIKLIHSPRVLIFKYSLTPSTASINDYNSPFGSEQSFVKNLTTTGEVTMDYSNPFIGSNTSVVLATRLNQTDSGRTQNYRIKHTFRIPFYIDGELGNLQTNIPPTNLLGLNTLRYGFEISFQSTGIVQTNIDPFGNVGYLNQEFNTGIVNHVIQDLTGDLPLDSNNANVIQFKIKNNERNWLVTDVMMFRFIRLLNSTEYTNQTTAFNTLWSLTEGFNFFDDNDIDFGIFSFVNIKIDTDPTIAIVDMVIDFPIVYSGLYALWVTTGDFHPSTDIQAENHIISVNEFVNNLDVDGLVDKNVIAFYESFRTSFPINFGTDRSNANGWNGDFNGCAFQFELDASEGAYLTSAVFRVIAENTTDQTDWFQLQQLNLFLSRFVLMFTNEAITTYKYQILNANQNNTLNIPTTDILNKINVESVIPTYGVDWQVFKGKFGFKMTWRDWIFNSGVPTVFYDSSKPNDNFNFKTSNYSGVNSYAIRCVLDIGVRQHGIDHTTMYRLKDTTTAIFDYDNADGNGFTAVTTLYDLSLNVVPSILTNAITIVQVVFNHSLGNLGAQNVWGEIFIEQTGQITQDDRLHTSKKWESPTNLLKSMDGTGFVNVISGSNVVRLTCHVNPDNVVAGATYNVYGRLGNKPQ
jgi:hypothetical protein